MRRPAEAFTQRRGAIRGEEARGMRAGSRTWRALRCDGYALCCAESYVGAETEIVYLRTSDRYGRPQRGFKRNRVLPQNRVLARPLRASGERCSAETCTSAESCTCLAAALTLIRAAPLSGGAGSRESCTSTETCTCVPLRASGEGCSAETCTSAESCTCALALRTLQIVYFREAPGAFALRVLLFFYI